MAASARDTQIKPFGCLSNASLTKKALQPKSTPLEEGGCTNLIKTQLLPDLPD